MPTQTISPVVPLQIDEETGAYQTYSVTDLTKVVDQNIKMVLLTNPGERLSLPDFGVGLYKYLFELQTEIERGSSGLPPIRENILSQISTYLPYIKITALDIAFNSANQMSIKMSYYVKDSNLASLYELTLSETLENLPV
jgi:phage baseplate assembly protein W